MRRRTRTLDALRALLRLLLSTIALSLGFSAIGQNSRAPFLSLPPLEAREVIGEWLSMPHFGPLYCTLSILRSNGKWMAFNDCTACAGYVPYDRLIGPDLPSCVWGVPLVQQEPHLFYEQEQHIVYSIQVDGRLSVSGPVTSDRSAVSILDIISPAESLNVHWK